MPAYSAIADSEIDPESPITTGLMTKYRDNLLAIITADPTAPSISTAAFDPGGSGVDGAIVGDLTSPGLYDASSVAITAAHAWPWATILRVGGNMTVSDVLTIGTFDGAAASSLELSALLGTAGAKGADAGGTGGGGGGGGAGGVGATGTSTGPGAGGASPTVGSLSRPWAYRRPLVGGIGGVSGAAPGSPDGQGGGSLIVLVNGNLAATGGSIKANGSGGSGGSNRAGGGGGSVIVVCTGQISGGTYEAKGGDGTGSGGGGGGGAVILVASSYGNARTKTVTKGSGGTSGADGYSTEITLTKAQILALCNLL